MKYTVTNTGTGIANGVLLFLNYTVTNCSPSSLFTLSKIAVI